MRAKEYGQLPESITEELDKINEQETPGEVPRVVISVASNLNYDNNTDSQLVEIRKKVNSLKNKNVTLNGNEPGKCTWEQGAARPVCTSCMSLYFIFCQFA